MLIELAVANFRSIRDEQRLSLVAGPGKELAETNTLVAPAPDGSKPLTLLRSAAIYGANAAGKSNLVKALATMRTIVLTSHQELKQLPVTPFRFNSESAGLPTLFEVVLLMDGVRYQYGFTATAERIHSEWLFAYPKGRSQKWFERRYSSDQNADEITVGDKLAGDKDVWRRATRTNALFLSTAVQLNSVQLQPLVHWFEDKLQIIGIYDSAPWATLDRCEGDSKASILDFLNAADLGIENIRLEDDDRGSPIMDFLKMPVSHIGRQRMKALFQHRLADGMAVDLDLRDESDGTQKMFAFAAPWLQALEEGRVLVVDELHDNLHPALVRFLVGLFHSPETNPKGAQLVFTTHETSILNQDILRRDQIWFCERDERQATRLYPLTDFSPRKGLENLERSYLSGRYGALPYLKALSAPLGN
jgi:AAA15 family ATPase/GTPase